MKKIILGVLLSVAVFYPVFVFASECGNEGGNEENIALIFGAMAILLILSKAGNLITRFGQPAVLGEILVDHAFSSADFICFFEEI